MFKLFTPQEQIIISSEFYSAEDASEYAQIELNLQRKAEGRGQRAEGKKY